MIRLTLEEKPVQWMDGDACMVGRRMCDACGKWVIVEPLPGDWYYLVRLSQPIADVLVRVGEKTLRPYPDSPIPEPTNTGRVV